jgi:membrane protein implicated in regulation of membrane protease activity
MFGGAGYAAHFLLLFGSLAAVLGLGTWMALGWAALIVAGAWAVLAVVLAVAGRRTLASVEPKPERAIESVKEDAAWVRHPRS